MNNGSVVSFTSAIMQLGGILASCTYSNIVKIKKVSA